MKRFLSSLLTIILVLGIMLPTHVLTTHAQAPDPKAVVSFTILHTNDFHGNLEPSGSNPGAARVAQKIVDVRTAVGASNVLLLDAGDIMQSTLLSNIKKGLPTIDYYKLIGYNATTFGNHEFDWGQAVLADRALQAATGGNTFPMVAANITAKTGGVCTGWDRPVLTASDGTSTFTIQPYTILDVAGGAAQVGVIGVGSIETPYITIASATDGLCFKDPADSIVHYYDEMKAAGADVIVVLSHNGWTDGGYGYGFTVYGDQTLAGKLNTAGKPVDLIIGGHSHTDISAAVKVGNTTVVQAHYAGRKVGRADFTYDSSTGAVTVTWTKIVVGTSDPQYAPVNTLIAGYTSDPAYQALINQPVGYTQVDLLRDYNGDDMMNAFVQDAIYNQLNGDADPANDVDMVFNNPGGSRIDWCDKEDPLNPGTYIWSSTAGDCQTSGLWTHDPMLLTYGMMYQILPFGNATAVGTMKGGEIVDLLNQSATLFKGSLDISGIRFKFWRFSDALPGPQPWGWGAYDIKVYDKDLAAWVPIDANKTYKVATNEFLAPAGQDGFIQFKYMKNITYWGDMLDTLNAYVSVNYATTTAAYKGPTGDGTLDGRIYRNGTDTVSSSTIIPVTILHHNDSHGNLVTGSYAGYPQLVTLINQTRAHNPTRTLLLSSGDNIQGDGLSNYFKDAHQGYSSDGKPLPAALQIMPIIKAFNAVGYDAMVLGNHEFNFGSATFQGLADANFPILQANLEDDGSYGIAKVPVEPYLLKTVGSETIRVAILGIGNPRIPNYELPSNIVGLTFTNPITTAEEYVPDLDSRNDLVVVLSHVGLYDTQDPWHDVNLGSSVDGIDVIVGGHTHTDPANASTTQYPTPFKFLPGIIGSPDGSPVLITQALRYNNTLGTVVVGLLPSPTKIGAYDVVSTAGRYEKVVVASTAEDATVKAIIAPYNTIFQAFNNTVIGQTDIPIDALSAFTQETNGANLQADASVWKLRDEGNTVDFHLSGAMTNQKVASTATPATPYTLTIANMFTLMPYENSLVVISMNGPQLKTVLERAYKNYYYYKYDSAHGGLSYYTTCMLDTDAGNVITYADRYPELPDGNNVVSLVIQGTPVDFYDADTYYNVSTVNYLAAGSCNYNNAGVTLWPLDQIVADTQFYVRDVVIEYIQYLTNLTHLPIHPVIENRLAFVWNRPPIAVDDSYSVTANGSLTVPAPGVLANDIDPDSDNIHFATLTVPPTDGIVTLLADGSFTYTPNADFVGDDTFEYAFISTMAKGEFVDYATVTIHVTPAKAERIPSQTADGGLGFAYTVDMAAFIDATSSPLTITAKLADGSALPAWLTFDPATLTFSGTPTNIDAGTLNVVLYATDPTGSYVTNGYQLNVMARTYLPMIGR